MEFTEDFFKRMEGFIKNYMDKSSLFMPPMIKGLKLFSCQGYECYAETRGEAHKRLSRLLYDIGLPPISEDDLEECMAKIDFDKIGGRKNPGFLKRSANNILKTTKIDQI